MNKSMEQALAGKTSDKKVLIELVEQYNNGEYKENQPVYLKRLDKLYNEIFESKGIVENITSRFAYRELTTLHKLLLQDIIDVVYKGELKEFGTYFIITPETIKCYARTETKNVFNYDRDENKYKNVYFNTTFDLVELIKLGGIKLALEVIVAYNLVR